MAERYDFYVHDNRKITFNLTEPIMREDSGVTDFVFHIPKILNDLEVSDWQWWLVFVNAKKEKYSIALTLSDDPERPLEYNLATYTVDYAMSIKAGAVQFALEAINTGTGGAIDNEWHTLTYETKVKETLQGNQAEYAETESDIISALIQEVRTKMNQVIGGATPTPAQHKAQMTDPQKVYLYTGTEQGEHTGNWYYHNGTQFVHGGVYGVGATDAVPTQGSTNAVSSGGVYSALDTLQAQIPQIDPTLSQSGQAADALETGRRIEELSSDLSDISTTGINLFDKSKALLNRAVNLSGVEYTANNFYCTDYISVVPSTNYRIAVGVGSASAYLTCAFYDSSKNFISGSFNSKITEYTVTTPENCAYLRINGAVARIDTQMVSLAGVGRFSDYQRIISGSGKRGVSLVSAKEIFYNKTTGTLTSESAMSIVTPDNAFNIGTSVNVGTTGGYLYWNKKDGMLYTSATNDTGEEIYLLATLSATREFESHKQYCTLDSAFPIFKLDLYNNKLIVQVNGQPCYLLYNGTYYAISANFHQEITLANHCAVIYSPESNSFEVVSEFTNYALSKGIPVMTRYYTQITCRVPYETIINDDSYKRFVCYGDSLTWYDGNAFTWGEHQGETCIGFESYIRTDLQARVVANRGESGKTTPQICGKILTATDLSNYDVMTIMGGDNDDRLGVSIGTIQPIGGTFDTSTVCGALQSAIEYALGQNPNLRIILMTEPMGWTYQNEAMDRVSELVPNAYKNVAKQYGLPLIDLWGKSGINELTRETFYADPAPSDNQLYMYHPNNKGWIRCSKIIVKKIKGYI